MVTPLDTWFAGEAARRRFRRRWLGRAPVVLPPRDRAWRRIAPGFAACAAMAARGLPFQIVADRRYDRPGGPRRRPAARRVGPGSGWRTLELSPGSLFHLPPFPPHAVVCRGRSLALSLTWSRRRARRAGAAAPGGGAVAGRAG